MDFLYINNHNYEIGNVSAGSWGPGNWLAQIKERGIYEADLGFNKVTLDKMVEQIYELENTEGYPYGQGVNKTAYGNEEYQESWDHINNSITLKITCYNRKLNTMFLGKRDG